MECYEGATMIKSFRGLLVDGGQDTIVLHTNDGSTGYRIVKFDIFPNLPGSTDYESTVQIWKTDQTLAGATIPTATATVDFSNQELIAASHNSGSDSYLYADVPNFVIFDNEVFNQDIYVTHTNTEGAHAVNYYIELEQMKLDLNENTVATLKDIRNLA
jgi:hypothetical protein